MLLPVSWLVLCAWLACTASFVFRDHRRDSAGWDLDGVLLAVTVALVVTGLVATTLAWAGWLQPEILSAGLIAVALLVWPWRLSTSARSSRWAGRWAGRRWIVLLLIGVGIGLRLPTMIYPLGGRDQGTYLLRAREVIRTGDLVHHDVQLRAAARDLGTRPGPHDILGLYPTETDPWRDGVYEGAYRPGFYLADRESGTVTPQFLHLHPMLLAVTGLALGPGHEAMVITLEAALALLAMWLVSRRLFASDGWAALATGLYALTPLAVWVHRNTLSETLAGLLLLSATLAFLRPDPHRRSALAGAFLLGAVAWVRGNGWMTAPMVLLVISLQPPRAKTLGPRLMFIAMVLGSVLVHQATAFPYIHDELQRQIPALLHGPRSLAWIALAGATVWFAGDRALARISMTRRTAVANVIERAPTWSAVVLLVTIGVYAWFRGQAPSLPASRLDPALPLLGWPLATTATVGILIAARQRWSWNERDAWCAAIVTIAVGTVAFYVPRNLPDAGLYYYGRYLVPEVVPAACLSATVVLMAFARYAQRRNWPRWSALVPAAFLLTTTAWPLVRDPITRLREFEGADPMMAWLAEHIPQDAIVLAGGEGWHRGHTFNQVGGALAMGYGRQVLPYVNREAAYATLHELLVTSPAAHGETPPPVYLLINEVTRARLDENEGRRTAAVDPGLPAPFRATSIGLLELILHRLTPVRGTLPTRVTRDELRLALMRVEVDRTAAGSVTTWSFRDGDVRGPTGLGLEGFAWQQGRLCVGPRSRITFPAGAGDARELVVVVGPEGGSTSHRWRIRVDDRRLPTLPPKTTPHEQNTLGPWTLPSSPRTLRLRGAAADPASPCSDGSLAEVRLLPVDNPRLPADRVKWAVTLAPLANLGHPYPQTSWVAGRGLSRYRTGTRPSPEIQALSLVLRPDQPLNFAPIGVPVGDGGIDVILTLTRTEVSPRARIAVWTDQTLLGYIDPPDRTDRAWQSPPLPWSEPSSVSALRLVLEHGENTDEVAVRDMALFAREPAVAATLVHVVP